MQPTRYNQISKFIKNLDKVRSTFWIRGFRILISQVNNLLLIYIIAMSPYPECHVYAIKHIRNMVFIYEQ